MPTADKDTVDLPDLKGAMMVDSVIYFPPNADRTADPLIKKITFTVEPGEVVAMVGPSRAGKSTLARLIVGAIKPHSGVIRLDGADIQNFDSDQLGRHIGYLSQEVELFPGHDRREHLALRPVRRTMQRSCAPPSLPRRTS